MSPALDCATIRVIEPRNRTGASQGCRSVLAATARFPADRFPVAAVSVLEDPRLDKTELEQVQRYLRTLFGNPQIKITGRPKKKESADVYLADESIGVLLKDEEDGELSYNFEMTIRLPAAEGSVLVEPRLVKAELERVQRYLRTLFDNQQIKVTARPKKKDSAEVYLADEFIGILFNDEEDGKLSYNFQMAILDTDLD